MHSSLLQISFFVRRPYLFYKACRLFLHRRIMHNGYEKQKIISCFIEINPKASNELKI